MVLFEALSTAERWMPQRVNSSFVRDLLSVVPGDKMSVSVYGLGSAVVMCLVALPNSTAHSQWRIHKKFMFVTT
jgi:hypothetical protein